MRHRFGIAAALALFGVTFGSIGPVAGAFPEKPIRMVVPFGTGGGTDLQGRLLSEKLRRSLGQQVLVDNRSGAGGVIGTEFVTKSDPDGYTLLFTTASLAVNVTLMKKNMNFDPLKDLEPVTWVSSAPLVLVVHPSVPAKSIKEVIALAKRTSGGLNMGANSPGTTSHLSAEMFKQLAKVQGVTVLYKGGGPAALGTATGEIDMLFGSAPAAMPHIQSGRIRGIAVTTAKRVSVLPDLPTMNSVLPDFESDNWYSMFLPAKTPQAVVAQINAEVKKALQASDVRDFLAKQAIDPVGSTPEELTALVKRDIEKYADVIKRGNISMR